MEKTQEQEKKKYTLIIPAHDEPEIPAHDGKSAVPARHVEEEKQEVDLEKWGWGVVYHPTQAQIDRAIAATKERNITLQADLDEKLKALTDPREIHDLKRAYQEHMGIAVEPARDEFHQFDSVGKFHRIGEIDQSRVELLVLYLTEDMSRKVVIDVPEGAVLIIKYNRFHGQEWAADHIETTYVIGYKLEHPSGDEYHMQLVLPDNTVVATNNINCDWLRFIKFEPI